MDLSVTYNEIRSEISFNAGWGRLSSAWDDTVHGLSSAKQAERVRRKDAINASIKYGLSRFYWNTLAPGTRTVYPWSFLRKRHEFTTADAKTDYDLPLDFGSPESDLVFIDDFYSPVPRINEARLLELRSRDPNTSGVTQFYATRHKPQHGATRQVQELMLFPIPTGAWELRLTYIVTTDMLDEDNQYPPGGPEHGRTILYACLAEAAKRIGPQEPLYELEYQTALQASISLDSRTRSANLGPNLDGQERGDLTYWNPEFTVAYDGTVYTGGD